MNHFEVVTIDGEDYKVPQAVVEEIENLRKIGFARLGVRGVQIAEDDTIIFTVPDGFEPQAMHMIGVNGKARFPDHKIAVLPESMGLHTVKGFAELAEAGHNLAEAIIKHSDDPVLQARAVVEWKVLVK